MPTQRDLQRLIALREAKKRGVLGATQSAAVGELENRFSNYFKEVGDRAKSVAEPAMTAASAAFAEPVSGLAGLAALPFGADVSTRAIEKTQDAMTYQPRTEAGKEGLQGLMSVMGPVGEAFEGASSYLGDAAYEATGSPAAGAAAYSVPSLGMELLGLKGTRAASKAGKLGKQFEMSDIGSQRFGQRGAASMPKGKGSAKEIMDAWKERGIKSFISERPDKLVLDKIIVPDAARGQGIGTQAMQELIDYADETGKRIELSPSADFGGSKKRLTEFYRRQGFIENKGKNKDFEISESMYRPPAKGNGVAESAGNVFTGKVDNIPEGSKYKGTVYHQTDSDFDQFDFNKSADGTGWFSSDKAELTREGSAANVASGRGKVIEADVELNKVAGWDEIDKYSIDELIQMGYDGAILDGDVQVFTESAIKRIKK